ncbi:MAG: alanine racemase [Bacteroidota bacterium]|nr:alanine racemase [Bacteroidota bacterium]
MAFIEFDVDKLEHNYRFLDGLFNRHHISWGTVSKLLCGHKPFLQELLSLGMNQVLDSRVSNLKAVKQIDPEIETIYIKPPAKRAIKSVVKFADISLNSELATIQLLSEEAQRQGKVHKVVIMIELGDLREGIMGENLMDFYEQVFQLKNVDVIGLGTNLSCLNGILPNADKLVQLSLYKQLIEAKFAKSIPLVSGGTSVTVPLLKMNQIPSGVNHFRVGETLFRGNDLLEEKNYRGMKQDVFKLYAEIIELVEKPVVPTGMAGLNVEGENTEFDQADFGKTTYRAILDIGLLDIDTKHMTPTDSRIKLGGASSDMIVADLGARKPRHKVGDLITFSLSYMGILGIMNSKYIDKRIKKATIDS